MNLETLCGAWKSIDRESFAVTKYDVALDPGGASCTLSTLFPTGYQRTTAGLIRLQGNHISWPPNYVLDVTRAPWPDQVYWRFVGKKKKKPTQCDYHWVRSCSSIANSGSSIGSGAGTRSKKQLLEKGMACSSVDASSFSNLGGIYLSLIHI